MYDLVATTIGKEIIVKRDQRLVQEYTCVKLENCIRSVKWKEKERKVKMKVEVLG